MPPHQPDPERLADEIAHQLARLTSHLSHLPPHQALAVTAHLCRADGILGGVADLVAAASRFARDTAERGALPADVWLALGHASNDLATLGGDLAEHRAALRDAARPPGTAKAPAPSPLVIRRHR
jgi:hypothetical protein